MRSLDILGDDVNASTGLAALIATATACDNAALKSEASESGKTTPARVAGASL